ncbi:MAG: starch-binding protein, partial [Muribaculaceae bacterium]|nr:starch-binding protein [Muribaculaceae bacterium]
NNTPWTYKYTVTFANPESQAYRWRIHISEDSDPVIKERVKATLPGSSASLTKSDIISKEANEDGPTIELSMQSGSDESGVGTLMVEVAPSGTNDWKEMPIAIYHTGFFHQDNSTYAVAGSIDTSKPYTYYGVVKIDNNRWLDRNIGAHSAELYIEQTDNIAQHGTIAGRGGYYYVAQQNNIDHVLYEGICPPGYQIPYITDWDAIRKSSNFITTNLGAYTTAYYVTDSKKSDGTNLSIYFSKSRYYDGANKAGDSTVGYYWSQTTATGFEKDERGRWMKSFVIFGEATQTSNARIDYSGEKTGFAMSLRCVSKHDEITDTEQVNMFVRGATHVFAYSKNSAGERVPVATWPGTPIANYNTADANYINYRYLGKTNAENLYLIFNYKGENGQIHSISKDGSTAKITTDISPNDLEGWRAKGDDAPNNSGDANHKTAINEGNSLYYWNLFHSVKKKDKVILTTSEQPYVPVVTTYQIHGTIFGANWDEDGAKKPLTRNGTTNVWEGTFTVSGGEFVIQMLEDGEESDAYRSQGGNSPIVLGAQTHCVTSTSNADGNFTLSAGTYRFIFNTSSRILIVIDPNADPRATLNATDPVGSGYHRVFWDNSSKNWNPVKIYCWRGNGEEKPFGAWPGREMTKVPYSSNYYYVDVPVGCQFIILNGSNDSQKTEDLSLKANDDIEENTYK